MSQEEDYRALIDYLNTPRGELRRHRKHRLPMECYAVSDCECFFTICARQHGQPFADATLAVAVVDALLWRKTHHQWTLYCYCLMPDHLHFLVKLPQRPPRLVNAGARGVIAEGILDHIGNFKKYTTTQLWWKHGGHGTLWQRSSYDRVIRYNDSIDAVASYILCNPVRKGLVGTPADYPFAGIVDAW